MPFSATCAHCGESFTTREKGRAKYCGTACYYDSKRKIEEQPLRRDTVSGDSRSVSITVDREIRNEKDLMEVCKIDPKEWRIADGWECTAWEASAKDDKAGELVKRTLFRVKARFVRNHEAQLAEALFKAMLADFTKRSPKVKRVKAPATGQLLQIAAFDAHIGMRAWPEETRAAAYDTDIGVADWDRALDTLLSRAGYWQPEKVVYVLGGDICHIDSSKGETFSGTQLGDMDTRYQRVVRRINDMLRRQVERIARDVAPVTVINVVGNHDRTTSFHVGEVLAAFFDGNQNVSIENTASPRAYYRWGKCLVGITHGDIKGGAAKLKDLANVMAEERARDWAECPYREWYTGHLHSDLVYQNHSVTVRKIRALCPPNAYASHELYLGNPRGMDGAVFDKEHGLVDMPRVTL